MYATHATVLVDKQSAGVGDGVAIVESTACLQPIDQCSAADAWMIEVLIPLECVIDCEMQCAVTGLLPVGHRDLEAAVLVGCIPQRTAGNEHREFIAEDRVRHTERHEQALACEFSERSSRYALDDDGREEIAGVGVLVARARR